MKKLYIPLAALLLTVTAVASVTWSRAWAGNPRIGGTWFVKAQDAPFQYHMFVFNDDGTMQQANPDAGDPYTSDSDGKGVWMKTGENTLKGKFVEVTADRETHQFVARGEISFNLTVEGNQFTGTASADFYDENNNHIRGPLPTPISGTRVTLE